MTEKTPNTLDGGGMSILSTRERQLQNEFPKTEKSSMKTSDARNRHKSLYLELLFDVGLLADPLEERINHQHRLGDGIISILSSQLQIHGISSCMGLKPAVFFIISKFGKLLGSTLDRFSMETAHKASAKLTSPDETVQNLVGPACNTLEERLVDALVRMTVDVVDSSIYIQNRVPLEFIGFYFGRFKRRIASLSHKNGEFYFNFKFGISGLLHQWSLQIAYKGVGKDGQSHSGKTNVITIEKISVLTRGFWCITPTTWGKGCKKQFLMIKEEPSKADEPSLSTTEANNANSQANGTNSYVLILHKNPINKVVKISELRNEEIVEGEADSIPFDVVDENSKVANISDIGG
ncbi:hypothetical protein Tco_0236238 [Tanacetum coccineum]